jgi:hypothetical protein
MSRIASGGTTVLSSSMVRAPSERTSSTERRPGRGKSPQRAPSASTVELAAASAKFQSSLAGYKDSCSSAFESAAVCASSARHPASGSSCTQCATASTAEERTQEAEPHCRSETFQRAKGSKKVQHMEQKMLAAQSLMGQITRSSSCVSGGHPSLGLYEFERSVSVSHESLDSLEHKARDIIKRRSWPGERRPAAPQHQPPPLRLSPQLRRLSISSLPVPGETVAMFIRFSIYAFSVCICLCIYCERVYVTRQARLLQYTYIHKNTQHSYKQKTTALAPGTAEAVGKRQYVWSLAR